MNENVPSLEEIIESWEWECRDVNCEECKLKDDSSRHPCHARYIHAVLTGEMKLTDSFRKEEAKPEPEPEPKFPAWCKEGAWVTDARDYQNEVCCVLKVTGFRGERVLAVRAKDDAPFERTIDGLKPICFRSYTFEEAKKLIGKAMEYKSGSDTYATIVYKVSNNSGRVRINDWSQEFLLNEYGATIDGVPLGAPEIDEEAMKERAE